MRIKSFLIFALALLVTLIISGCAAEHEISIKISPVEGGQIDGEGIYEESETVELKATPEEGFYFSGWEEDGKIIKSDKTYVFEAKENRNLKAVFKEKQEKEHKEEENDERTISKEKEEAISSAINAGLEFLINNPEKGNPWDNCILLDYFYRKFELDERYAFENTFDDEKYEDEITPPLERLGEPDYIAPLKYIEEETKEHSIQWFMARSMYSDHHPVNKDFMEKLSNKLEKYSAEYEENVTKNAIAGYWVTHVILCFRWLHELGYDLEECGFEEPWEEFADHLVNIAESQKAKTDLGYEAIAFLQYIDQGHRVEEAWIENILSHQTSEGGWPREPDKDAHGHPTHLAVWALLEYINPQAEAPMLR